MWGPRVFDVSSHPEFDGVRVQPRGAMTGGRRCLVLARVRGIQAERGMQLLE